MTTDGGGAMAIAVNGKGSSHEERKKIALLAVGRRVYRLAGILGHKITAVRRDISIS